MKRFALFGGTFDPFTPAHKAIVEALAHERDLNGKTFYDEIWIMPTIVSYYRTGKIPWLSEKEKIDVINAMLDTLKDCFDTGMPEINIWDEDLKLNALCKTPESRKEFVDSRRFIHTLYDFKAAMCHEDDEVHVVIGADSFANFNTWYMWKDILSQAKLEVVVGRGLSVAHIDIPHHFIAIDPIYEDMSGSKMRDEYIELGVDEYIRRAKSGTLTDKLLCHTPIFDVVKGMPVPESNGLKPIKVIAPDWVSIMVEKEGRLLVEKQFRYGANDFIEEFPCGMVEEGEDPRDAVVRELEEETGIRLLDKKEVVKLGQTNPNPAFMTNMMHYYFINLDYAKYEQVDQKLDEHEEIKLQWKDKDKFMFDLADDAHACRKTQVPAIALSMVKLYENSFNYPSCGS